MSEQPKIKALKIFTQDGNEVLKVYSINRERDNLIMDCKVLDAMRMDVMITPDEIFSNLGMLSKAIIPYVFLMPWLGLKHLFKPGQAAVADGGPR
ncbi:MAG: hypothetical protein ABSA18_06100 [Dehalococcoidia bacterium]|jgi:hypothetical protein